VILEGLISPEFSAMQRTNKRAQARVFDQPNSPYDLVLGLDLLAPLGIDISCLTQTIAWLDQAVAWKPKSCFDDSHLAGSVSYQTRCLFADANDDFNEWIESHSTTVDVKSSEHEKVDAGQAAVQQTHLTPSQQAELAKDLNDFTNVFSNELGCHPGHQVHLELNDDMQNLFT
jgi:hypothetical protein